jgi:Type IV secretion system pilin
MNIIKPVYAKITNPVLVKQNIGDDPKAYINSALQTVISIFFIFGLIYFIYHFIISGYHMISSQGDPKKYEEAQHALLYSLLGIGIIFSVFAILKVVGTIFGIEGLGQLEITWPTL